ncbi:MAG TPA: hypothetical protein VFF02_05470, partial [Anaeromyxobacteraceae bacterium]|nr:hypothetical protein [Anaeromyxobacteraceae bacterium]
MLCYLLLAALAFGVWVLYELGHAWPALLGVVVTLAALGLLLRRCDVRAKYASRLASRAALQLDLFEQPGPKRVFQHPA